MIRFLAAAIAILSFTPAQAATWVIQPFEHPVGRHTVKIRAGYLDAEPGVDFKGNILYVEGLADSMLNHAPLFNELSHAGYRVIAFDYMGQGGHDERDGSGGSMNDSRIVKFPLDSQEQLISTLADQAWKNFHRPTPAGAPDRKIVMGWSTGGLAAFEMAAQGDTHVDALILLSPGIYPKVSLKSFHLTEKTLTSANFAPGMNPHVDPLRIQYPGKLPLFLANLFKSAAYVRYKTELGKYPALKTLPGLALLAGKRDTLVNDGRAEGFFNSQNTPHFEVYAFPNAVHELDNEQKDIAEQTRQYILDFLARLK